MIPIMFCIFMVAVFYLAFKGYQHVKTAEDFIVAGWNLPLSMATWSLVAALMAAPPLVVHLVVPAAMGFGDVKVALVVGGEPLEPQVNALRDGSQIVVGTPGRVIDHLEKGSLDLSHLDYLVLDEADRDLDGQDVAVIPHRGDQGRPVVAGGEHVGAVLGMIGAFFQLSFAGFGLALALLFRGGELLGDLLGLGAAFGLGLGPQHAVVHPGAGLHVLAEDLDDVHVEAGELARDLDLLGHGEAGAGRLLTVAQGGVEDAYRYVHGHQATPSAASPLLWASPVVVACAWPALTSTGSSQAICERSRAPTCSIW